MPAWVPVAVALSLIVIALSFVGIALGILLTLRSLNHAVHPALKSLTEAAESTKQVAALVRREGEGVADSVQRVRTSVDGGLERLHDRLEDLDALYEVLYEEMKETGLELGVALRRVRHPRRWWRRVLALIG